MNENSFVVRNPFRSEQQYNSSLNVVLLCQGGFLQFALHYYLMLGHRRITASLPAYPPQKPNKHKGLLLHRLDLLVYISYMTSPLRRTLSILSHLGQHFQPPSITKSSQTRTFTMSVRKNTFLATLSVFFPG